MSDERMTEYDYAPAAGRGPEQTVVHTNAAGLIEGSVAPRLRCAAKRGRRAPGHPGGK